jgi:hypothetical protein
MYYAMDWVFVTLADSYVKLPNLEGLDPSPSEYRRQHINPKGTHYVPLLRSIGNCLARFWSCLRPITSFFLLILSFGMKCVSYACPTIAFWKHLSCLLSHAHSWRELCLKKNCTSSVTHIWLKWFILFLQYWGLNSGPTLWTIPPALCDGFFWDRVSQTIWLGWLWTIILLISASLVARTTGANHQHPASHLNSKFKRVMWALKWYLFIYLFFVLFICAYNVWVVSLPFPRPFPKPLPFPPTPLLPGRNYFALIFNFVEERV